MLRKRLRDELYVLFALIKHEMVLELNIFTFLTN